MCGQLEKRCPDYTIMVTMRVKGFDLTVVGSDT